ncbi:MAG: hypothetical protein U0587_20960 [Candidatus Binatia bacterium]
MFEDKRERDLAPLALTLWVLLLIIAGVGGWFMMNGLKKAQAELAHANQTLQSERTKAAADRQTTDRCNQQLTAAKTELATCNTNLAAESAKVKQLEASKAAPARGRR